MRASWLIPEASVAILLWLSGCASSPPTTFLTLDSSEGASIALPLPVLALGDLELPPIMDRRSLVSRTGAGEVKISESAEWAAPLKRLVRQTLSENLAARLPRTQVLLPGQRLPDSSLTLVFVTIQEFWMQDDGRVSLRARWGIQGEPGFGSHEYSGHETAQSRDPTDVALAMSHALAAFSEAIGRQLGNSPGEIGASSRH